VGKENPLDEGWPFLVPGRFERDGAARAEETDLYEGDLVEAQDDRILKGGEKPGGKRKKSFLSSTKGGIRGGKGRLPMERKKKRTIFPFEIQSILTKKKPPLKKNRSSRNALECGNKSATESDEKEPMIQEGEEKSPPWEKLLKTRTGRSREGYISIEGAAIFHERVKPPRD